MLFIPRNISSHKREISRTLISTSVKAKMSRYLGQSVSIAQHIAKTAVLLTAPSGLYEG